LAITRRRQNVSAQLVVEVVEVVAVAVVDVVAVAVVDVAPRRRMAKELH
jgi:hypothetical protein